MKKTAVTEYDSYLLSAEKRLSRSPIHDILAFDNNDSRLKFRVTIPLVQHLQLTSRQKFRFGLACPDLARPRRNFCLVVNRRFCTS